MFLRDTPPTVEDFELLPSVLETSTDELTTFWRGNIQTRTITISDLPARGM
jgi:hypothetical protein